MSRKPELSIIVPVYKVEPYLRECIDSILAQTFQDFELILVDDGSPDNCGSICDEYASKLPERITVVHKPNGGLSSARNAGLDVATGKYIGFVDSDDAILPSMYEDLIACAHSTAPDVVFSQMLKWESVEKSQGKKISQFTISATKALERIYSWKESVSVCSKIFRRELIDNLRFRHGLTNEDFPFVTEALLCADKVTISPYGYYRYRVTPGSITNVMRPSFFDIFNNIDYVGRLVECGNDEKSLKDAFKRYALTLHIMSGVKIVKGKHNRLYKSWLRNNRRFILKNLNRLLFDTKLSLRWRAKAAFSFLRFP